MKTETQLSLKPTRFRAATATLLFCLLFVSCGKKTTAQRTLFQLGERLTVGSLTYTVLEAEWKSQLGDAYKTRFPEARFLVLRVSITNGGGTEAGVPLLTIDKPGGQSFAEVTQGDGIDEWMGLIRAIAPAETLTGRIAFDVPMSQYRLRLTSGGDLTQEQTAYVEIPLTLLRDETPIMPPKPADAPIH